MPCQIIFTSVLSGMRREQGTAFIFAGSFLMSFLYHPVVLYSALIYISFMVTQTMEYVTKGKIHGMLIRMGYLYGALAIIGVNWVVKNVLLIGWGIDFLT